MESSIMIEAKLFVRLIFSLISSNALAMIELSFFELFVVVLMLERSLAFNAKDKFCLLADSVNTDKDLLSNKKYINQLIIPTSRTINDIAMTSSFKCKKAISVIAI